MTERIDVLVVDEDSEMLELTKTFLQRESDRLAVHTEQDPLTAAERVTGGEFDCVVSDLRMPEMDGIELCNTVHAERPSIPFFLFTAADEVEISDEAATLDLTGTIQKGTGTDHYAELAAQIEAAVE